MNPTQFSYWLQGYSEINGRCPNKQEWAIIKDHITEGFLKNVTISAPNNPSLNVPSGYLTTGWFYLSSYMNGPNNVTLKTNYDASDTIFIC